MASAAEQGGFCICQERLKVRRSADADRKQLWKGFRAHADSVEIANEAALGHHFRQRDIYQNSAEADRHQKQRLITLADTQVKEQRSDQDHDHVAETEIENSEKKTFDAGNERRFHEGN